MPRVVVVEEYEEEENDDDDENENENGGGENKITKYTNAAAEVDQELYIPKPLSAENKLERLLPKDNYDAPVSDEEVSESIRRGDIDD